MLLASNALEVALGCFALVEVFVGFFYVLPMLSSQSPCAKAWLRSYMAGLDLPIRVVMMPEIVVPVIESQILAHECCLVDPDLTFESLREHGEAGGDVLQVVRAMVEADRLGVPLSFREATAIDRAGKSVMEVITNRDRRP